MNKTYKITGRDAVRLAERDRLTIYCYTNPIEDGGVVEAGVARQIVRDDPALVYVTVSPVGWWDGSNMSYNARIIFDHLAVGDFFTPDGHYMGPDEDGIEPTWEDA